MDFELLTNKTWEDSEKSLFGIKKRFYIGIVNDNINLFDYKNKKIILANGIYPITEVYEYDKELKTLNYSNIQKIQIFYEKQQKHKDVYLYENGLIFKIQDNKGNVYYVNEIIKTGKIFNLEYQVIKGFNVNTLEENTYVLYNKGNDLYYGLLEYNGRRLINVGNQTSFLGIELQEVFIDITEEERKKGFKEIKIFINIKQEVFIPLLDKEILLLDIIKDDIKQIGGFKDKNNYQKVKYLNTKTNKISEGYLNKYGNLK